MKRFFTFFLLSLVIANALQAQPDTLWTRLYELNHDDWIKAVEQTPDSGYVILTAWGANSDPLIIKTNAFGDTLWTKNYLPMPEGGGYGFAYDVAVCSDGGYVFAGGGNLFPPLNRQALLVKTNAVGDTEWTRTFGGDSTEILYTVIQAIDGSYWAGGTTNSYTETPGDYDTYFVHVGDTGNVIETNHYGSHLSEGISDMVQATNGDIVCVGGQNGEIIVMRLGENGYFRTIYYVNPSGASSICATDDGGCVVAGCTACDSDGSNVYFIKFDPFGVIDWERMLWGDYDDGASSIRALSNGGFIIGGCNNCHFHANTFLVKADYDGNVEWTYEYPGSGAKTALLTYDNSYIILTRTVAEGNNFHPYLIKTMPDETLQASTPRKILPLEFSLSSYPNPFNITTTITFDLPNRSLASLALYDVTGRFVMDLTHGMIEAGNHQISFDASTLSSGIYFAKLSAGSFTDTHKLVLLK